MKKIVAVCGLGEGTSLILRMNVEQVLAELGVEADVEHIDESVASDIEADVIVTNKELAKSLTNQSAKIVIINNYFDLDEIKNALKEQL